MTKTARATKTVPTQTPQELAAQITAIEAERTALLTARSPIDERLRELYEQRRVLTERAAAFLDPTSVEGLEALWRAAWDNGNGNRAAADKLVAYARSFAPEIYSVEWHRDRISEQVRPVPNILLIRGQEVNVLAKNLLSFLRRLNHERESCYVSLFEHSLSAHGSYGIAVELQSGLAELQHSFAGTLLAAPLVQVLARAARDHWYEREPGAQDEDGD